jgi:hypothetical protein
MLSGQLWRLTIGKRMHMGVKLGQKGLSQSPSPAMKACLPRGTKPVDVVVASKSAAARQSAPACFFE